MKEALDA